ncbi:hypothetical protein HMPREF1214_01970 [Bacteroides sp. HPS0048]|nr:hypothetical protein HMPREF1214_01970 [Bacteroides sp. HPS0048]
MRGLLILLMLFLTLWIYHPILYTLVYQKWFFFNLVEPCLISHFCKVGSMGFKIINAHSFISLMFCSLIITDLLKELGFPAFLLSLYRQTQRIKECPINLTVTKLR